MSASQLKLKLLTNSLSDAMLNQEVRPIFVFLLSFLILQNRVWVYGSIACYAYKTKIISKGPHILSRKGSTHIVLHIILESRLRQTGNVIFAPRDQLFPLVLFTVRYFYSEIICFTPFLYIWIVLSCFYLLIFYFEKFSAEFSFWIWRLPFAVTQNLSIFSVVAKKMRR